VKHERETRRHVKRLQDVFKILGKPARAKTCDAIMGITKEGAEIMPEYKGMPALAAGLLAAAQAKRRPTGTVQAPRTPPTASMAGRIL
jgi:ferritin-like metal-binding protein YciE